MRHINREEFEEIVRRASVKPRLRRELKFVPEDVASWEERELLAVADRTAKRGVLFIELDALLYVVPYQLHGRVADKTGRSKPITCDFCYTWQAGGKAGRITFGLEDERSLTFLCCADLQCSLHVRSMCAAKPPRHYFPAHSCTKTLLPNAALRACKVSCGNYLPHCRPLPFGNLL
jgi:hypothetical protein